MSVNFTEPEHLVAALEEMGFKPQVFVDPVQLHGYHGDLRQEKAHIVVSRLQIGSASNDIGFAKQQDGTYRAIISEYDARSPLAKGTNQRGYNAAWLGKLSQIYTKFRVLSVAKQKGYALQGQPQYLPNGKLQIRFAVK